MLLFKVANWQVQSFNPKPDSIYKELSVHFQILNNLSKPYPLANVIHTKTATMKNQESKNENLADKNVDNAADKTNMPDQLVPRHHSDENSDNNKVKSDAGNLGKNFGRGDFGSEEAREDAEKGNKGEAGNMPNSKEK